MWCDPPSPIRLVQNHFTSTWQELNGEWIKEMKTGADEHRKAGRHKQAIQLYKQLLATVEGQRYDHRQEVEMILGNYHNPLCRRWNRYWRSIRSSDEANKHYRCAYDCPQCPNDYKLRGEAAYNLYLLNPDNKIWLRDAILGEHLPAYRLIFSHLSTVGSTDSIVDRIIEQAARLASVSRGLHSPLDKLPKLIYYHPSYRSEDGKGECNGALTDAVKLEMLEALLKLNIEISQDDQVDYCNGFIKRLKGDWAGWTLSFLKVAALIPEAALEVADEFFSRAPSSECNRVALNNYRLYLSAHKSVPSHIRTRFLICLDRGDTVLTSSRYNWLEEYDDPQAVADCPELVKKKLAMLASGRSSLPKDLVGVVGGYLPWYAKLITNH